MADPSLVDAELISLSGIAEMAGVKRPAVSNWRRRHKDFPEPVRQTATATSFRLSDVEAWLQTHNKPYNPLNVTQRVWSAFDSVRGVMTPAAAIHAGLLMAAVISLGAQGRLHFYRRLARALDEPADGQLFEAVRRALDEAQGQVEELASAFSEIDPEAEPFLRFVGRAARNDRAGVVFEALLDAAARNAGMADGTTPQSLVECLLALARPIHGTVYDPWCHTGEFLYAARRESGSTELNLLGQEHQPAVQQLAGLRMLVHGLKASIRREDPLSTTPSRPGDSADLVLTDPPKGLTWDPPDPHDSRWFAGQPPSQDADTAFLQHSIKCLRRNGRAFVVTRSSAASVRATDRIRRRLLEYGCIHALIALPSGLYLNSSIGVTVWVLGPPSSAPDHVLLINAQQLGKRVRAQAVLDAESVAAIADCYHAWIDRRLTETAHQPPHRELPVKALLAEDECDLAPEHWALDAPTTASEHNQRIRTADQRWRNALVDTTAAADRWRNQLRSSVTANGDGMSPLAVSLEAVLQPAVAVAPRRSLRQLINEGQVALFRGLRFDPDSIDTGNVPVVWARDLHDDWTFTPSTTIDPDLIKTRLKMTEPGDILIAAHNGLNIAIDQAGGSVTAATVHILRPQEPWIDPLVLATLLGGARNRAKLRGTRVLHTDVLGLEVPSLSPSTYRQLSPLLAALHEQRRRANGLAEATEALFDSVAEGISSGTLSPTDMPETAP